jgi:5-methylcytosine-specific restriction endonuclease McrA
MKQHPRVAQIDNRWRARRVIKCLALCSPLCSEGRRYYQAIYDATFFIV